MDRELKDLLLLDGISGYETNIRKYFINYSQNLKNYQLEKDNLGSVFFVKKSKVPNAKVVMVAGHMDEVGLMVVEIKPNGLLKLNPVGGLTKETLVSQVLKVHGKNNIFYGVVPSIPPHLSATYQSEGETYLDIGLESYDAVINAGISLGSMVTFKNEIIKTAHKTRYISKAIDNRFGCALALLTAYKYDEIDLPFDLVIGATVQEEVGLRGAETATKKFNPDVFIALDASPLNDALDSASMAKLGDGFLIRMIDPRNIMQKGLFEYFQLLAKKRKIKHQFYVAKGGTDAAKALDINAGVLATTIGLPARYIHSNAALFDLNDYNAAKKMLFCVLNDLNNDKIKVLLERNR